MNNLRLLTVLFAALSSGGACAQQARIISLEEIFSIAETGSSQLRAFSSAAEESEKEISVARSGLLPDINATLSLSYIGDGFTTKRDFSDYQKARIPHFGSGLSLSVTQPVYTGGVLTNSIRMAELKSTAARYAEDFQRYNIRFKLTGFYLDIYKYHNLKSVVESNLSAARKVLEETYARYEQGTALRNDITRYELLVENLDLQLTRITNTLEILNANLVTTAGLPHETVVIPDSTMLSRSIPVQGSEWWNSEAQSSSPSLALARTGVSISRMAEDIVKAERLPKIGLQAGWSIDGPILVEVPPINRNLSYWYIGVGINYTLSSLYKTNKSITKSRVATIHAEDELRAAEENISLAVKEDYIRLLEAYEELKTMTKSVELAERNYDIVATRYSADMALITDMLDAANSRLDAQQQLVNARINIIYYYYKLLFTTGKI